MIVSLMAYVKLHDRLVLGSTSAFSVGVLVSAVSLLLVLERIMRVLVQIVWVVLVAISKVTSSRFLSAIATAAIATSAAVACRLLPALPSPRPP